MTMSEAIVEAIGDAMAADSSIFLMGQDIGEFGGPMNSSKGLWERFGPQDALIDAPISEAAMVGTAIGAAMAGARPIVDLMFGEFVNLAMTPLGLEGASVAFRTAGGLTVPVVVRAKYGTGPHRGHPETPVGALMNFPGLKIVAPTTPQDSYSLMSAAIADPNPVVFLEHMSLLHAGRGNVDRNQQVPIGAADVVHDGDDVTIVTSGMMVKRAVRAAKQLAKEGIAAEIVDLRTIKPLDVPTILRSAQKTQALLLVEESWPTGGPTSEICTQIVRHASLDGGSCRIDVLAPPDVPIPYAQSLENSYLPDTVRIVDAVKTLVKTEVAV
ncbi:alpha-ketoacid dehydrogenase subunit beta [Brevibacterium siliguriense]|nr:transketolase C-terminal domain-containing protein [Brevibacterium siliguriense]